jgi:hypothetical protein
MRTQELQNILGMCGIIVGLAVFVVLTQILEVVQ